MDSKADDQRLFRNLKDNYQIRLVTTCCKEKNKTPDRKHLIAFMQTKQYQKYLKEPGYAVEPMQGLVKEIFDLDRCWMRKDDNNQWLFAAMGLAVQMHQLQVYRQHKSTWKIKSAVLRGP